MFARRGRAHPTATPGNHEARPVVGEGFEIPLDTEPMEARAAEHLPAEDGSGSMSRNGTAFVVSPSRRETP